MVPGASVRFLWLHPLFATSQEHALQVRLWNLGRWLLVVSVTLLCVQKRPSNSSSVGVSCVTHITYLRMYIRKHVYVIKCFSRLVISKLYLLVCHKRLLSCLPVGCWKNIIMSFVAFWIWSPAVMCAFSVQFPSPLKEQSTADCFCCCWMWRNVSFSFIIH